MTRLGHQELAKYWVVIISFGVLNVRTRSYTGDHHDWCSFISFQRPEGAEEIDAGLVVALAVILMRQIATYCPAVGETDVSCSSTCVKSRMREQLRCPIIENSLEPHLPFQAFRQLPINKGAVPITADHCRHVQLDCRFANFFDQPAPILPFLFICLVRLFIACCPLKSLRQILLAVIANSDKLQLAVFCAGQPHSCIAACKLDIKWILPASAVELDLRCFEHVTLQTCSVRLTRRILQVTVHGVLPRALRTLCGHTPRLGTSLSQGIAEQLPIAPLHQEGPQRIDLVGGICTAISYCDVGSCSSRPIDQFDASTDVSPIIAAMRWLTSIPGGG